MDYYLILIAMLYARSNKVTSYIFKENKWEPRVLYPAKLTLKCKEAEKMLGTQERILGTN